MSESSGARAIEPVVGRRLGGEPMERPAGMRVVLDARPLQAPDRAPLAATYLDGLLGAYDADPLDGESFSFLIAADLADVTDRYEHLDVAGRRRMPPTRLLRAGSMTLDPFFLRGAAFGTAWRADRRGAAGAVYHAVGSGPLPIASGLPLVVTLLDQAPWDLPEVFARSRAGRFGQRIRTQLLRDAAAVIVGSEATASAASRLIRIRPDRIHVVRLAPRAGFGVPSGRVSDDAIELGDRLGLGTRYLVLSGRFDARLDLSTLLAALALLAAAGRPPELDVEVEWPPRVLLVGATPADRASIARAAARRSIGEAIRYAPGLGGEELAGLVSGARAVVMPAVSEAAGLPVVEAIASGVPVIASAVGPLPELVGQAGLLVEPGDPDRLARALAAMWADDDVHGRLAGLAAMRAAGERRTWIDVAGETRTIYARVGAAVAGPS